MSDSQKTYRVKANDFTFSLDNADMEAIDLLQKSPEEFNLIMDHRSVNARLLEADINGKKIKLEVDGEVLIWKSKIRWTRCWTVWASAVLPPSILKRSKHPCPDSFWRLR